MSDSQNTTELQAQAIEATPQAETTTGPTSTQSIFEILFANEKATDELEEKIKDLLGSYITSKLSEIRETYFPIFLWDSSEISNFELDKIYEALAGNIDETGKPKLPVLLILKSPGGSIEPAYKISKICNSMAKEKFVVCIPREAKSAATLISLGATELHMGPLSELGPIDPQIGGLPALGLQDSLKYIASLVKEVPEAKDLFALYLNENFKMNYFGWTYRITESAVQYGTRLLSLNSKKTGITTGEAESIPHKLVMEYKDHSFVIDFTEAQNVFKNKIVQTGTKEIAVAEGLYSAISMLELALRFRWKKRMTLVGNPMNRSGIHLFNLTNK